MRAWIVPALLVVLGLMQMAGDLLGIDALKGIGAVSGASPAPKVFSSVMGLETYSTDFFIEGRDAEGRRVTVPLTSERYADIRGPYNRRNVYGAALVYGPILSTETTTAAMYDAIITFALCGDAPIARELELPLDPAREPIRIRLEPQPGTDLGGLPLVLEAPCRYGAP